MPSYIADSFTKADALIRQLADEVSRTVNDAEVTVTQLAKLAATLDKMDNPFAQGGYLETVQFIKQRTAADPSDEAWRSLDKKLDKVIIDFRAAKNKIVGIVDAIDRA